MVHHGRITVESSSSSDSNSDSNFLSASSHETSPTSPVENSAPSTEPLKCQKRKRDSSGNDNDNKTKSSKRPRSQEDHNEEPSHPEHTRTLER
ncbi:hypothetical protein P692DRAFT_20878390 [Suillus brevipes Sb2]|nr:hypothetical protein P692DRAFT_20878390 [Suillus brevipes Sb2]